MSREVYAKHHYSTPLFVLRETFNAFRLHNGLSLSASLSFYAMFALIPMALLMFFMLSHLVISSDYAIVKLAIITSNLVPKFSQRIMVEVYNISRHQAVWGAFGMFALLWIVTPLAGALRSAFYTISAMVEAPSFLQRKIKDVFAVLGILLMFFMFTFFGLVLEKVLHFLDPVAASSDLINLIGSIMISSLLIALFYSVFFPARVAIKHIFIGSLVTAVLWIAMRPLFGLFLSLNQSYGTIFGGMKNMFISIGWLYYTFAVFLLGTELISTLHKKHVLLLRGLFDVMPADKTHYLSEVMNRYGQRYKQGDFVFHQGEDSHDMFYLVSGDVSVIRNGKVLKQLVAGDYFGEMAVLAQTARIADARVDSVEAEIVTVSTANIQTLILGEPKVAMNFLKQMATQLQNSHQSTIN